jgi:hypothetical protein
VQVGVVDLDAGRRRDVGSGDGAGTLLAQVHDDRLVVLGGDDQTLDVEDDLGDVLLDPGDRGELVQHTVDADAGDRRAGDARQQGATQGVAEGVAEARLERLDDEARPVLGDVSSLSTGRCAMSMFLPSRERPLYDAHVCRGDTSGREAPGRYLCP